MIPSNVRNNAFAKLRSACGLRSEVRSMSTLLTGRVSVGQWSCTFYISFSSPDTRRGYESPRALGQHAQSTHGRRVRRSLLICGLRLFHALTMRSATGSNWSFERLLREGFAAGT
jgi:hypothetical protein